jgi:DNA-directed RNA polymerase specialized sigma24 family protein
LDPIRKNSKISEISLGGAGQNSSSKLVPLSIFSDKRLTPLEAIVKYLREKRKLSYHEIASLLERNVRDIYKTYAHAFDKCGLTEVKAVHTILVPVSIFANRELSALENLVLYLKNLKLTYRQISILLNRNERTIWTVYQRARQKNAK